MSTPRNSQLARTVQEKTTPLSAAEVIAEAKVFFARRSGIYAAFPEQESSVHLTLRGQGGEEIVIGTATGAGGGTRVTASTYLFDQQVARFLDNLPSVPPVEVNDPFDAPGGMEQQAVAG
ncbi:MAG: hypothetical protein M3R07_00060 [Gemmatimonadota bacterium]|nr:hypothetical protein [Gemmatimonadota bacterium]